MSLVKPVLATILILSGTAVACSDENNPALTLMISAGRAIERRRDAEFRVMRHQDYRSAVEIASGSRQMLKLAV